MVAHPAIASCGSWRAAFAKSAASHGAMDLRTAVRHGGPSFCNLVGVIKGRNPRLAPILVGAHYDSAIAAPCADDNGRGRDRAGCR
jgi:hypothetical protein